MAMNGLKATLKADREARCMKRSDAALREGGITAAQPMLDFAANLGRKDGNLGEENGFF